MISKKTDVWPLGVIMYELFSECKAWKQSVFTSGDRVKNYENVIVEMEMHGKSFFDFGNQPLKEHDLNLLINQCCSFDYNQR